MDSPHINAQQLWQYINFKGELSASQHDHLATCAHCMELFRRCVLSETPESVDDDELNQRSA